MSKQLKKLMREELTERFRPLAGAVVISYTGLDSEKIYGLRRTLRQQGARMQVVKNSLARLALKELRYPEEAVGSLISGPVALVYGETANGKAATDPVVAYSRAAKAITDWRKKNFQAIEIRGGFLERIPRTPKQVEEDAKLPSREAILATLLGTIQAPVASFASALQALLRKFVGAVDALREKREKEGAGAA